jgi:hypothetical protein
MWITERKTVKCDKFKSIRVGGIDHSERGEIKGLLELANIS